MFNMNEKKAMKLIAKGHANKRCIKALNAKYPYEAILKLLGNAGYSIIDSLALFDDEDISKMTEKTSYKLRGALKSMIGAAKLANDISKRTGITRTNIINGDCDVLYILKSNGIDVAASFTS